MKPLKAIRVTSDGRLEGTTMEKPAQHSNGEYDTVEVRAYESSWREFEDQWFALRKHLPDDAFNVKGPIPNTTIDVPKGMPMVEEVEQVFGNGKWNDRMFSGDDQKLPSREYRTVLRFVSEGKESDVKQRADIKSRSELLDKVSQKVK